MWSKHVAQFELLARVSKMLCAGLLRVHVDRATRVINDNKQQFVCRGTVSRL